MPRLSRFLRERSLTLWDMIVSFGGLVLSYLVFAATFYITRLLALPRGTGLDQRQWRIILLAPIALVVFTYVKETVKTRGKDRQIRGNKVIYDCIGGAIEQLAELKSRPQRQKEYYISELLKYIEKVIALVLKDNGVAPGEICANLMARRSGPERLDLEYFGTFLTGRAKRTLPVDGERPLPGAPQACQLCKPVYVDDTLSPEYRDYFGEGRPYRSVVSIPIYDPDQPVFAVLNIDSNVPKQFVSGDFIAKEVLPTIGPLVSLLRLERELVVGRTRDAARRSPRGSRRRVEDEQ